MFIREYPYLMARCGTSLIRRAAGSFAAATLHGSRPQHDRPLFAFTTRAMSSLNYHAFTSAVAGATAADATRHDQTHWADLLARAETRCDEWRHPMAPISFWLLKHKDAPKDVAFDPSSPLADDPNGANKDVLAMLIQMKEALYGLRTCTRGVTPHHAVPLIKAAAAKHNEGRYANEPNAGALVALPGLCEWVRAGERWGDASVECDDVAREAAMAVALGKPRPGHSVLGLGTFTAAEPCWVQLASKYEAGDGDVSAEKAAYEEALVASGDSGSKWRWRIKHMADGDPEYIADAGGAMLVFNGHEEE